MNVNANANAQQCQRVARAGPNFASAVIAQRDETMRFRRCFCALVSADVCSRIMRFHSVFLRNVHSVKRNQSNGL